MTTDTARRNQPGTSASRGTDRPVGSPPACAALDLVMATIALVIGFGGLSTVVVADSAVLEGGGSLLAQAVWMALIVACLFRLVGSWTPMSMAARALGVGLVGFTALASLSTLWSVDPSLTFRRSIALAGTLLVGVHAVRFLGAQRTWQVAVASSSAVSGVSLVALVAGASWATADDGTFVGLTTHRNTLGAVAALGVTLATVIRMPRRHRLFAIVTCGTAVIMAESRSATVSLIVALVVVTSLRARRSDRLLCSGLLAICAAVAVGLVALAGIDGLLGSIGRSSTLTGRTDLWAEAIEVARQRPVLGHGFGAFWETSSPELASIRAASFEARGAHSAPLDTSIALGLVGLAVLAIMLGQVLVRAVRWSSRPDGDDAAVAVAVFIGLRMLVESGVPAQNSAFTILLVVVLAAASVPVALGGPPPSRAGVDRVRRAPH